jgi:plastocyanin
MSKKILVLPVVAVVTIIIVALAVKVSMEVDTKSNNLEPNQNTVSITMSSSRPGCDSNNNCYVPATITVNSGESVVWVNDDSAFHTVTSGYYDIPDGAFDSGQLDPGQKFLYIFEEKGESHYYCRLHPWMEGQVIVR